MASPKELRQNDSERPAQAGRLAVLRTLSPLHLAFVLALAATVVLVVFQLANSNGPTRVAAPQFVAHSLGAPHGSAKRVVTTMSSHRITVGQSSYMVVFDKSFLSLAPENGRGGEWKRFADGVSRPMPFGGQTIVFGPTKVEEFETVNDHFGRKVWRWRLSTSRFKTASRSDGGVAFSAGGVPAGFRILVTGLEIARAQAR